MQQLKCIDWNLLFLLAASVILLTRLLQCLRDGIQWAIVMAGIGFTIFCLMTLVYLYVVYIRKRKPKTPGKK